MYRSAENYSLQTASFGTPLQPQGDAVGKTVAFTNSGCDWRHWAERRLVQLCGLKRGWDGHDGLPADHATAVFAAGVVGAVMLPSVPQPSIMPMSYGGIQIEWHRNGWDIEIEVAGPNRVIVYTHELASGEEQEFPLEADLSALRGIVAKIKN